LVNVKRWIKNKGDEIKEPEIRFGFDERISLKFYSLSQCKLESLLSIGMQSRMQSDGVNQERKYVVISNLINTTNTTNTTNNLFVDPQKNLFVAICGLL
jgi:hypothetical protein